MFCETPNVGDIVKITVSNKGNDFPFGSFVEVLKIEEWSIVVRSIDRKEIVLHFNEFIMKRI